MAHGWREYVEVGGKKKTAGEKTQILVTKMVEEKDVLRIGAFVRTGCLITMIVSE